MVADRSDVYHFLRYFIALKTFLTSFLKNEKSALRKLKNTVECMTFFVNFEGLER